MNLYEKHAKAKKKLEALINSNDTSLTELKQAGNAYQIVNNQLNSSGEHSTMKVQTFNPDEVNLNNYSLADAIIYASNPETLTAEKREYYRKVNAQTVDEATEAGVDLVGGGNRVLIPARVMNATTAGDEYSDVGFDQQGGFVEHLNDKSLLTSMGTDYLFDLQGNVKFPKETAVPSVTWDAETAETSESDVTFDNVTLSPKRAATYVDVSQQLLRQTSQNVNERIKNSLFSALTIGVERAAINGGGENAPTGILEVATEVTAPNTYQQVQQLEAAVTGKNVDIESLGYLMNAKTRGFLKGESKDSGSGRFVMEANDELNSYKAGVTNMVAEETGEAPNNSPLIYGNFNDLVIGMWGPIELIFNPYTKAKKGLIELVLNAYIDVGILHDESFVYSNIVTTAG